MRKNKVFFDVAMSLDGFIAPAGMDMAKWSALQKWVFGQKFFRENLKLGDGGETGEDNRLLEETFERTGVSIMGKNMFRGGETRWPEEAPFHTPVFVLTHEVRKPWERSRGTTFYFVNEGIESALRQAREVAGDKDIRIAGGANVIQQFLNAGLIDEFTIHSSPVFLGEGLTLFVKTQDSIKVSIKKAIPSKEVTHITYQLESDEVH